MSTSRMVIGLTVLALAIAGLGVVLLLQQAPAVAVSAFAIALLVVPFGLAIRPTGPGVRRSETFPQRVVFGTVRAAAVVGPLLALACTAFVVFGTILWADPHVRLTRYFFLGIVVAAATAIGAVVEAVRTLADHTITVDARGVAARSRGHEQLVPWTHLRSATAGKGRLHLRTDERDVTVPVRRNRTDPAVIAQLIQHWVDDPAARADFSRGSTH